MGVELINQKAALAAQLRRTGGQLPTVPDGPLLPCFHALEMARALEHELERAAGRAQTKIRIDMNFNDAQELASYLRRAALMGA